MKRLSFILVLFTFCLSACVHENSDINAAAYSGSSTIPAWPSDSARNVASGTGTGPTGLIKSPDTIPKGFMIPNPNDTSQKKKF